MSILTLSKLKDLLYALENNPNLEGDELNDWLISVGHLLGLSSIPTTRLKTGKKNQDLLRPPSGVGDKRMPWTREWKRILRVLITAEETGLHQKESVSIHGIPIQIHQSALKPYLMKQPYDSADVIELLNQLESKGAFKFVVQKKTD